MPRLFINGTETRDDWHHLDEVSISERRRVTVSLGRWLRDGATLSGYTRHRHAALGIRIKGNEDPQPLHSAMSELELIILEIEDAADGRYFSTAACLREQFGYRGELRAGGDVTPDHLSFMLRCGINAFVVADDVEPGQFIGRYARHYQTSTQSIATTRSILMARRESASTHLVGTARDTSAVTTHNTAENTTSSRQRRCFVPRVSNVSESSLATSAPRPPTMPKPRATIGKMSKSTEDTV